MKFLLLFLLSSFCIGGCAHQQIAVISDPTSPWHRYDRCSRSGQYRFIDGVTFAVLVGDELKSIEWRIVGNKPVQIEFTDEHPKILVTTSPSQSKFKFTPAFRLDQEINPQDPVHEIPNGMTTDYDYDSKKLYFGTTVQPLLGSSHFERKGEVKNPRFITTDVRGRILSNSPNQGYLTYGMRGYFELEVVGSKSVIVEIPRFKLNDQIIETQHLRFHMGERSNTDPFDPMHCSGSEPRGWWYYILRLFN